MTDYFHEFSMQLHENFFLLTAVFIAFLVAIGNNWGGLAVLVAATLGFAIRPLVKDPRPAHRKAHVPEEYGFPSGHAATSSAFAFSLLGTPYFWPAFALCLVISASRVNLRVHSEIQVVGGMLFGAAVAIVVAGV